MTEAIETARAYFETEAALLKRVADNARARRHFARAALFEHQASRAGEKLEAFCRLAEMADG